MQLKSIIEALKFCENDSFVDSIKLYTNNQQYFKQCFENEKSRKKNKDLQAQIDKLKLDKGVIIFPEDKDNAVKQSRGMKILEAAMRDTQAHSNEQYRPSQFKQGNGRLDRKKSNLRCSFLFRIINIV